MNLILFGFRGVGKTYFGRRLAEKLERPFFDTDVLLAALYDGEEKTPRSIYQAIGEEAFRALETQVIEQLSSVQNAVIALGGGAVLKKENVALLQTMGELIYLATKEPRFFKELYVERKPLYEAIPARRVSVDQIEAKVLEELLYGL